MIENIVLVGARMCLNLGGPSMLSSVMKVLSEHFPNAGYTMISNAAPGSEEDELAQRYGVRFVSSRYLKRTFFLSGLFWRCAGRLCKLRSSNPVIRRFQDADCVIDIMGIMFADSLGKNTLHSRMREGWSLLLGKLLRKPVIKYTAALGPFETKWNRRFAGFYLNRCCDLILARDDKSRSEVEALGVKTETLVCPDTAFLFDSVDSDMSERLSAMKDRQAIIGLSVSFQAYRRAEDPQEYIKIMAGLVRHLCKEYSAHVVIIPNELSSTLGDDLEVSEEVFAGIRDCSCEILPADKMFAEEIKGVIGQCDVVVAARYHTIVAALSLGIPVLALGWHHKYREILGLFGQEQQVCNIGDCRLETLVEKFDSLWKQRHSVREAIRAGLPEIKERIRSGARRTCEVLKARP